MKISFYIYKLYLTFHPGRKYYSFRERNIYFKHVFAESETCNGGNSCCSPLNQCVDGEGDCDNDNDCEGNLVCGVNNCDQANPAFDSTDDCCFSLILGTDKHIFFPPKSLNSGEESF